MIAPDVRQILTNSRLKTFRRCKRLHRLRYDLGYRPIVRDDDLELGTLVHEALEAWWTWDTDLATTAILPLFPDEILPDEHARLIAKLTTYRDSLYAACLVIGARAPTAMAAARAMAIMVGYDRRWRGAPYKPIAVEAEWYAPLRNPATGALSQRWMLGGKFDVIAEHTESGEQVIIEHKTSREDIAPGSRYWRRLVMDGQASQYFTGARAIGYDPQEIIYDVLRKPALRPLLATPEDARKYTKAGELYKNQRTEDETAEEFGTRLVAVYDEPGALEEYFVRQSVPRLELELREFEADAWSEAKIIRSCELEKRAPRNPDACELYGKTCGFFDVCSGAADLNDPARFERLENPHAELEHVPKGGIE